MNFYSCRRLDHSQSRMRMMYYFANVGNAILSSIHLFYSSAPALVHHVSIRLSSYKVKDQSPIVSQYIYLSTRRTPLFKYSTRYKNNM